LNVAIYDITVGRNILKGWDALRLFDLSGTERKREGKRVSQNAKSACVLER